MDPLKDANAAKPETLAEGRFLRLVRRGKWEYATRKGVSGIVGIVAVTDDGRLVLVEQDRPPVGKRVIELPAGLAGDVSGQEDEELASAARRELLEETGYAADEWVHLGGFVNDGNRGCGEGFYYLARGAQRVAEPATDDLEEMAIELMGLDELARAARAGDVAILSIAAAIGLAVAAQSGGWAATS